MTSHPLPGLPLPGRLADGTPTAGVGYLPGHPLPFQCWYLPTTNADTWLTGVPRPTLDPATVTAIDAD